VTDRLKGCVVVFSQDFREDDVDSVLSAIRHIRGVAEVTSLIANTDDYLARARVRYELRDALWETFAQVTKDPS
jgi:hypothetical protein